MALTVKEIAKVAQKFRERLEAIRLLARRNLAQRLESLAYRAEQLKNCRRLMQVCLQRRWFQAADRLGRDLIGRFPVWRCDLDEFEDACQRLTNSPLPKAAEIVAELRQAEAEFGALMYKRKEGYVAAVTEPITLEDVYLGEFEIRLLLTERSDCQWNEMYRVVAKDPHPADLDSDVTHPHVRAEILCAGAADESIREALLSGRLCDFFLLVRSVLRQYNSGSPHVALEHWQNSTCCYDCGSRIGGDSSYCETCNNEFCDDCVSCCQSCYASVCQNCRKECKGCEESVCDNCVVLCSHCKSPLCKACETNKRCPCQKKPEPESEKEIEENEDPRQPVKKTRTRNGRSRARRQTVVRAG